MKKIFIDGKSGTTGLRIYERLSERKDVELIILSDSQRRDLSARKDAINRSDVTFLCLPDEAAKESVSLVENPNTVIIDASTAHRTDKGWVYGFPELTENFAEKAKALKRIAVPGCHASGFIALCYPLVKNGLLDDKVLLTCTSVTGYSGGGKKMIADYETEHRQELLNFPRQYGLTQSHKHLKEMVYVTGLKNVPAFSPIVAPFYSGMEVTVPIFKQYLKEGVTQSDVVKVYEDLYKSGIVYVDNRDENGFISSGILTGKDSMAISVFGNEERLILCARYDNLGKGASGAAIQCLNYILDVPPQTGLIL